MMLYNWNSIARAGGPGMERECITYAEQQEGSSVGVRSD